jgi:hypothetical protein
MRMTPIATRMHANRTQPPMIPAAIAPVLIDEDSVEPSVVTASEVLAADVVDDVDVVDDDVIDEDRFVVGRVVVEGAAVVAVTDDAVVAGVEVVLSAPVDVRLIAHAETRPNVSRMRRGEGESDACRRSSVTAGATVEFLSIKITTDELVVHDVCRVTSDIHKKT